MNKKKILNLLVASSTIAGGIGLSSNVVQATEVDNNANTDGLTQNTTKVDLQTSAKVINVNSNLNVRSDAGINYDTIGYVYNGQEVKILSEKGDWYRISFEGREGYVSKEYISIESENKNSEGSVESVVSESNKQGRAVNVNSTLNIRQSANTNSPVLGTLKNGDIFEIISKTGEWYNIKSNNIVGFISANYVQEVTGNETTIENVIQTITENYEIEKNEDSASTESGVVVNVLSNLRVRRGASASSDVMGYLLNGQAVSIKGETSGWYKIDFNGQDGYVSKEYIQKGSVQTSTASHITSGGTGKVVNVSSHLNIRSGAGTGYSIVGSLSNGVTVNILGKSGSWYHISHNGITGYVSAEYLQEVSSGSNSSGSTSIGSTVSSGKGQVYNVTSNLRVRSNPSTSSTVLGYLLNGEVVDIIGSSNGWVHINYQGSTGYVSAEYIKNYDGTSSTNATAVFNEVYNAMRAHIGTPYVWGGSGEYLTTSSLNSLKSRFPSHNYSRAEQYVNQGYRAFDCSGLMQWGFRQAGIIIGRTTYDQINNGYEVSLSNLQPGDLLFYGDLSHVGMYIGNGQWIESPNSNANIRVTTVPWSKVTRARRVIC